MEGGRDVVDVSKLMTIGLAEDPSKSWEVVVDVDLGALSPPRELGDTFE